MTTHPPLGAPASWTAVMEAAGHRCQCAGGACGSQHSKSGLRCDRTSDREQLLAAPYDLTLSPIAAAAVPVQQLQAWCPDCHKGAAAKQRRHDRERRRQQETAALTLFDL